MSNSGEEPRLSQCLQASGGSCLGIRKAEDQMLQRVGTEGEKKGIPDPIYFNLALGWQAAMGKNEKSVSTKRI